MCQDRESRRVLVFIPARLSYTGEDRFDMKPIDACIADIVEVLNFNGIYTTQSCCGHGKCNGSIQLLDGRELIIVSSKQSQKVDVTKCYTPTKCKYLEQASGVEDWCPREKCVRE